MYPVAINVRRNNLNVRVIINVREAISVRVIISVREVINIHCAN